MKSWLELEARFRALEPKLHDARLSAQWGAAGEHWHISGMVNPMDRQEFELLCAVGGKWIEKVCSKKNDSDRELIEIQNPRNRWYTLLKNSSPLFHPDFVGEQKNNDGSSAGFIYSGTINSMAAASANLCLSLHVSHPLTEEVDRWKWLHDNYIKAIVVGVILLAVGTIAKLLGA